ncbi:MAG: hypothetical protein K6T83_03595 [Alicyclobacillus sp.]|nr:hypothetical protein [Alicyclobacillus sp.]
MRIGFALESIRKSNTPPGTRWVTIMHRHVLINDHGEIVGGHLPVERIPKHITDKIKFHYVKDHTEAPEHMEWTPATVAGWNPKDDKIYLNQAALNEPHTDISFSHIQDFNRKADEEGGNHILVTGYSKHRDENGKIQRAVDHHSIIHHEIGHWLMEKNPKEYEEALRESFGRDRDIREWARDHISERAGTSQSEAIAEMFALYLKPDYPKGFLPKPIEDYFDKLLGKSHSKPKMVYHTTHDPNFRYDPNFKNRQQEMGRGLYTTPAEGMEYWHRAVRDPKTGERRKHIIPMDISEANIIHANDFPSDREMSQFLIEHYGDPQKARQAVEAEKPDGDTFGVNPTQIAIRRAYAKAKGYHGIEMHDDKEGSQIMLFDDSKVKYHPAMTADEFFRKVKGGLEKSLTGGKIMLLVSNGDGTYHDPYERRARNLRKATTDRQQRREDRRALAELRDIERVLEDAAEHEEAEMLHKARSPEEWKKIKRRKKAKYGSKETFADPYHSSYPLTLNGKPSWRRTRAAWGYINQERNAEQYTPEQLAHVKSRIRSFAKKHFGKRLESHDETKKSFIIVFPIHE